MPGIYVVTSTEFVKRTRATLRNAEFGFFGVCVYTRMHTPRFSGQPINAGDFVLTRTFSRPMRTNCENVGTIVLFIRGRGGQLIFSPHRGQLSRAAAQQPAQGAQNSAWLSQGAQTKMRESALQC